MIPKSGQGETLHFLLLWMFVGFPIFTCVKYVLTESLNHENFGLL